MDNNPFTLQEKISSSKAVLFDLFHTLFMCSYDPAKGESTSQILGVDEEEWNQLVFDQSWERMCGQQTNKYDIIRKLAYRLDPSISEETIIEAADRRDLRFYNELRKLDEPNASIIQSLKSKGKRIGLVSNADCVEVRGWFEAPIATYFDTTVFSYQVGFMKPEPEIYQQALDHLGLNSQDCVFVGDGSNHELEGAKKVGFTTVLTTEIIGTRWPEKIPDRRKHADYEISNLRELI